MSFSKDDIILHTEFSFTSGVGGLEASRFLNEYVINIKAHHFHDDKEVSIGSGKVILILLGLAVNQNYNPFYIFDSSHSLLELGENIYDFDTYELKEELQEFYNFEILSDNICFLERIEILPKYRSKGLGKKIIKNFVERFSGCCGLYALKAFPLQLEARKEKCQGWYKKMRLDELEQDEEKAKHKLYSYYRTLGFDQPFNNEYFFHNPVLRNDALELIDMEMY